MKYPTESFLQLHAATFQYRVCRPESTVIKNDAYNPCKLATNAHVPEASRYKYYGIN